MKFRIKIYSAEGNELEIENKIIGDILFVSEQAIELFINAIGSSLPPNFKYKVFYEKGAEK
ncbi:hypothetical protein [Lederbergia citrea]|uniref:Uncharacterized protein n=1 Tax=Lederbergia citrea TaxID=2833581 RepID=A0A942UN72_9BACI|nr:hypothetical protein [Lederbergia citrea]MBS4221793.1 hypothetical protein [Lederbergia citrea]